MYGFTDIPRSYGYSYSRYARTSSKKGDLERQRFALNAVNSIRMYIIMYLQEETLSRTRLVIVYVKHLYGCSSYNSRAQKRKPDPTAKERASSDTEGEREEEESCEIIRNL